MIKVFGRKFNSFAEICRFYKVSRSKIYYRMHKLGLTLEQALVMSDKTLKFGTLIYEGECITNITDFCNKKGIPVSSFRYCIARNMTVDEAIKHLKKHKGKDTKFSVTFRGTTYASIQEMCEAYDIKPCTYSVRLRRGMSMEEALTTPVKSRNKHLKPNESYNGISYRNLVDFCVKNSIDYDKLHRLLGKGEEFRKSAILSKYSTL